MDMIEDMKKLESIMAEFSLYPVIEEESKRHPIDRLIFCNILADKYEELRVPGEFGTGNKLRDTPKQLLTKYLGYTKSTAVNYQLRDGAIETIAGYKDYEDKYKVIKAGFFDDPRYLRIKKNQKIRDDAQTKMTSLMKDILED